MMENEKLLRINELYKKAKAEGLTPEEEKEQKALRAEYIAGFRQSLRAQLDNVYVIDKEGNEVKIGKKNKM